jgi:hypothetical protein
MYTPRNIAASQLKLIIGIDSPTGVQVKAKKKEEES